MAVFIGISLSKDVQNAWCREQLMMGGLCLNGNIHASGVLAHAENKMKLFFSRHKWFDIGGSGSREKAKNIDGEGEQQRKTREEDLGTGWPREYAVLQ